MLQIANDLRSGFSISRFVVNGSIQRILRGKTGNVQPSTTSTAVDSLDASYHPSRGIRSTGWSLKLGRRRHRTWCHARNNFHCSFEPASIQGRRLSMSHRWGIVIASSTIIVRRRHDGTTFLSDRKSTLSQHPSTPGRH